MNKAAEIAVLFFLHKLKNFIYSFISPDTITKINWRNSSWHTITQTIHTLKEK